VKYQISTLLAATAGVAMLLQLSWQLPEVWNDPKALLAAVALLVLGAISGSLVAHSESTRRAIRLLAFFFFVVLGIQWASSFRDDFLIWGFRWMCLGLLSGSFLPMRFGEDSRLEASSAEKLDSDEPEASDQPPSPTPGS
jgi:hypothetical protein